MDTEIRLNKYLSDAGVCSRREADRLIDAGKVTVDGATAAMGMKVSPGQEVVCDGKKVGGKEKTVFLMVYKPKGIVCTTSDKDHAQNIVEFLHYPVRIYPVGRLDKDSEGLLLMTNEGDIVNRILRAGNSHEKEYAVAVDRPVDTDFLKKMCAGVWLEDLAVTTKPCRVWKTGPQTFHVVLTQGLNRQIRRMCRALGYHVMNLKRVRIMNLKLGDLKRGECRELSEEEIAEIREMVKNSTNLPMRDVVKKYEGTAAKGRKTDAVFSQAKNLSGAARQQKKDSCGAAGPQEKDSHIAPRQQKKGSYGAAGPQEKDSHIAPRPQKKGSYGAPRPQEKDSHGAPRPQAGGSSGAGNALNGRKNSGGRGGVRKVQTDKKY